MAMNVEPITHFPNAPDIESSTLDYARRFDGKVGAWLLSFQDRATKLAVEQSFGVGAKLSILDVGGGHGQNIQILRQMGHDITVHGSDESCKTLIEDHIDSGTIKFSSGPLLALPYEENSFDVVICYRILSHMASWQDLIGELVRVSKNIVIVDYPCLRSLNVVSGVLYKVKKHIEKNTRPFVCYHDREIDLAFHAHSANIGFRHRQFFLPMAFYRLLNNLLLSQIFDGVSKMLGLNSVFGSPVVASYSVAR